MIPLSLRTQIADELLQVADEIRRAKDEGDEAHADLWLTSLADRFEELVGEYSAEILARAYEEERVECRKIVDLSAYRS